MNDSFKYFYSRIFELLHKKSFDTYRVNLHNPFTIFEEFHKSIVKYNLNQIKHFDPTITGIGEEAKFFLDNEFVDDVFKFGRFSKKIITGAIENNCIKNKDGKKIRTLLLLCKTIHFENSDFKIILIEKIKNIIIADDANEYPRLDCYISWLLSQLLFEGYSRKFILLQFRRTKWPAGSNYINQVFTKLSSIFSQEPSDYEIIFKVKRSNNTSIKTASSQIYEISSFPEAFNQSLHINDKFKNKSDGESYLAIQIKSNDFWSALKIAHQIISETIEINLLHDSEIKIAIENQALIIHKESQAYRMESIHENLDGFYNYQEEEFFRFIDNFKKLPQNSIDREKIRSAIRFYKLGNESIEIEHKILNYWIGFEQLFASIDTNEDSIKRIKSFFIAINSVYYWQRRTNYLLKSMERSGIVLSNKEDIINLPIQNFESLPPLFKYRLKNYREKLNDGKKLKASLEKHGKRLDQHLTRIYRIRNEIVHEGNSSVDLFLIAGHLRHYLVFSIEQLTNELIENPALEHLDDVFVYFENLLESIKNAQNIQEIFKIVEYNGYME